MNSPENSFYDVHKDRLGPLIEVFGLDPALADDLPTLVEATQPWVKGDHARPELRTNVSDEQSVELHSIYDAMGLTAELPLDDGSYEYLLVPGAVQRGNNRRLSFVKERLQNPGFDLGRLILLGGERRPYWETENTAIESNILELKGRELSDELVNEIVHGSRRPESETDLIRLAAAVQLGNLVLKSVNPHRFDFDLDGLPISILHTSSVPRENGPPRHTTAACMKHWLDDFNPSQNSRAGFVATNPHIFRMARAARRVLRAAGRNDINLIHSGPGALKSYTHEIFRGEVARNLYEDLIAR